MSEPEPRRHRRRRLAPLGLVLLAPAALAQPWLIDGSSQAAMDIIDNPLLAAGAGVSGRARSVALGTSLSAARESANQTSRLALDLSALRQQGAGDGDRMDGRLALSHAIGLPRGQIELGANLTQDFNSEVISADVAVGRGRRRSTGLSASLGHAFTERLSASAQWSGSQTGYGRELTRATDFRSSTTSASASWRFDELQSLSLQALRSGFRTLDGRSRSVTDSLDLGWSRQIDERSSASLSLGGYRTLTSNELIALICSDELPRCESGEAPYLVLPFRAEDRRRGTDYQASASRRIDETTAVSASIGRDRLNLSWSRQQSERDALALTVARRQAGSGVGSEVRSLTLLATASWALGPRSVASLRYEQSRSRQPSAEGALRARQQALTATHELEIDDDWSLRTSFRHTNADNPTGERARSTSLGVSLKYTWARGRRLP